MTEQRRKRALVIGGSMAGLFAGHYLRRAGWDVDVFERTSGALSARGAGIMTHPELRAALAELGLAAGDGFGVPIEWRVTLDGGDTEVARHRCPQIATSWTRVHDLLANGFPVAHCHPGADLVGIDETAEGVTARFADGRTAHGDLLVGADGLRSVVRRHLYPGLDPQYAGYVAWRGLLPEAALDDGPDWRRTSEFRFCLPPGEQMLGYSVAGTEHDLRPGRRNYNFVWYRPAEPTRELPWLLTGANGVTHELSIPPNAVAPAVVAELRAHAGRVLAPWFQTVVARTEQPFLQPIYDLQVPAMARGRIVLIGDAAFVVRPHVGAGVLKAAGDAQALAAALTGGGYDPAAVLAAFSAARVGVGRRMVAHARRLGSYLKYTYASDEERRAAALAGAPATVMADTAVLDFLRTPD